MKAIRTIMNNKTGEESEAVRLDNPIMSDLSEVHVHSFEGKNVRFSYFNDADKKEGFSEKIEITLEEAEVKLLAKVMRAAKKRKAVEQQTNGGADLLIQYAPMVNEPDDSSRLAEGADEEPDFFDIEVLRHNPDGSIDTIESHEDITSIEESNLIFETLKNKYPNAEIDILAE